jgi:predicted TPR repeat methyltransferase
LVASTPDPVATHYARVANQFDDLWTYSDAYVTWMTAAIVNQARLGVGDRLIDLGCGTGLYARRLADHVESVVCVDPSARMLARIPSDPRLTPVLASAELIATGQITLPGDRCDVIVIKEAIHHIADRAHVLAALTALLGERGRLLVAMLPATCPHPLFAAARQRFEALQPAPEDVAAVMRRSGLAVSLTYEGFPVRLPRQRYLDMVRSRYMSLLAAFDDDELAAGVDEIQRRHPRDWIEFVDQFAFVLGMVG